MMKTIGVLALQGGVDEHINALLSASEKLRVPVRIAEVRSPEDMESLDGLILPGGESTAISRLMLRENIFEKAKTVRKIMGTCAGAVLLAKKVEGATPGQRFLSLMDVSVARNAYGSQLSSFEADFDTILGKVHGVFIRAPKMSAASKAVQSMAFHGNDLVAAYQTTGNRHHLALTFHPELTTTKFHEFFLKL
ncbi:MAG: pyridoxal 5'-phosphate synthase glutaminase subunit PdxT [Candidatus Micrarchaeia archaeon]